MSNIINMKDSEFDKMVSTMDQCIPPVDINQELINSLMSMNKEKEETITIEVVDSDALARLAQIHKTHILVLKEHAKLDNILFFFLGAMGMAVTWGLAFFLYSKFIIG